MLMEHWVSGLISIQSGSVVYGCTRRCINPSLIRNFSPWCRQHVLFRSDNEAVVHILISRTSKVPCIMHVLLDLLSAAARFNFTFTAQHIPGIHNNIADALSRFHWQEFRRLAPDAQLHPVPVSHQLWELLIPPH